jgi:hypothetical protein
MKKTYNVYLECGAKRTFAGGLDWPGWCRQGPNEAEALAALFTYAPKYAKILSSARLHFIAPKDLDQLVIVERLSGTATTDFGAISVPPSVDHDRSCDANEVERFEKILHAGWRAFDKAVRVSRGKTLARGPRGGGRSLDEIVAHVVGADGGYLAAVGWKPVTPSRPTGQLATLRKAIIMALRDSATGRIAERGPRGGQRWTARFFVRRVAWHVIAHIWEIERRTATPGTQ